MILPHLPEYLMNHDVCFVEMNSADLTDPLTSLILRLHLSLGNLLSKFLLENSSL